MSAPSVTPSRDHVAALARPDLDGLARERAAAPRSAGHVARAVSDRLMDSPRLLDDPLLAACVGHLRDGHDPVETIAATLLAYAEDRARLLALATRAMTLNGPVILDPVDAFAAPAHNPGARVVATGGGR